VSAPQRALAAPPRADDPSSEQRRASSVPAVRHRPFAAACAAGLLVLLAPANPNPAHAQTAPPPGYVDVPLSPDVLLNPAHEDTVGSEFTQNCNDANPDPPGPGEVG
jgi:hypothetical protein